MPVTGGAYDIVCTGDEFSGSQSCWCQYKMIQGACEQCHRAYVDSNTPVTKKHWICAECWPSFCWSKWSTRPCDGQGCRDARLLNIASRHESERQRAEAHRLSPVPVPIPAGPPPPGLGTVPRGKAILTPGPYHNPIASPASWYGQPSVQMQPPDQDAAGNAASSSSGMGGNPGATTTHQGPVSHQAKYARRGDSPALQATAQAKTEIVETSAQTTTLVTSLASAQTTTLVASPPCQSYQTALNQLVFQHILHQPNLGLARTMPIISSNRSDSSSSASQWHLLSPAHSNPAGTTAQCPLSVGGLGASLPVQNVMPRVTVRTRPSSWNHFTIV